MHYELMKSLFIFPFLEGMKFYFFEFFFVIII